MSASNPYSSAADAYGNAAVATDQRALESRILIKAALKLETLKKRLQDGETPGHIEIGETLEYNQKLWQIFVNDTMNDEHPLPTDIKSNIASLGVFIFKRTRELMVEITPEKLDVLITINRNIASGLMAAQKNAAQEQAAAPDAAKPDTDSIA